MQNIVIDNFTFRLIGKSVPDRNDIIYSKDKISIIEERFKVRIESEDNTNHTKQFFDLYSSVSELFTWRLCIRDLNNSLIKFNNYIQTTLIDLRLQKFIWDNFNLIPYIENSDFVLNNKSSLHAHKYYQVANEIKQYKIELNNKKNLIDLYTSVKGKLDIETNKTKTLNLEEVKTQYGITLKNNKIYIFSEVVDIVNKNLQMLNEQYKNINYTINKKLEQKEESKKLYEETKKYINSNINPNGIIFCQDIYTFQEKSPDYSMSSTREKLVNNLNRYDFYEYFDIINNDGFPIIIPNLIISHENNKDFIINKYISYNNEETVLSHTIKNENAVRNDFILNNKINYFSHKKLYQNIKYNISFYGIRIKNKITDEIFIAQILDFSIKTIEGLVRNGKTIINFIKENTKINQFGLYNEYYVEDNSYICNESDPEDTCSQIITTSALFHLVSKPLDYALQQRATLDQSIIKARIFDKNIYYIDLFNISKFVNVNNCETLTIGDIIIKQYGNNIDVDNLLQDKIKQITLDYKYYNKDMIVLDFLEKVNFDLMKYKKYEYRKSDSLDDAGNYIYIGHYNVTKPIINELLLEELEESYNIDKLYEKKYLKYKAKYLQIKNSL